MGAFQHPHTTQQGRELPSSSLQKTFSWEKKSFSPHTNTSEDLQTKVKMLKLRSFQKKTKKGLFAAGCPSESTPGTSYKNSDSTKQTIKNTRLLLCKNTTRPGLHTEVEASLGYMERAYSKF